MTTFDDIRKLQQLPGKKSASGGTSFADLRAAQGIKEPTKTSTTSNSSSSGGSILGSIGNALFTSIPNFISGAIQGGEAALTGAPAQSANPTNVVSAGATSAENTFNSGTDKAVQAINDFNTPTSTATKVGDIGEAGLGLVSDIFSIVTAPLAALQTVPVAGDAVTGLNAIMGAVGQGASKVATDSLVDNLPLSQATKDSIKPFVGDLAAFAAQAALGKVGADASGALLSKAKELSTMVDKDVALQGLNNNPAIQDDIAKQQNPTVNVPVLSDDPNKETPVPFNQNQIIASDKPIVLPKASHADYAKAQGYEPYTPPEQLPTIDMGKPAETVKSNLPSIDYGAQDAKINLQPTLESAPPEPVSNPIKPSSYPPSESLTYEPTPSEVTTTTPEYKVHGFDSEEDMRRAQREIENESNPKQKVVDDIISGKIKLRRDASGLKSEWKSALGKNGFSKVFRNDGKYQTPDAIAQEHGFASEDDLIRAVNDETFRRFNKEKPSKTKIGKSSKPTDPLYHADQAPEEAGASDAAVHEYNQQSIPQEAPQGPTNFGKKMGTANSGLAERISAAAVEKGLKVNLGDIAKFDPKTFPDQATRIADLVNNHLADVRDMIRGTKPVPEGISPAALNATMRKYAFDHGDTDMINDLVNSPLTSAISEHASELSLSGIAGEDDPVKLIQDVNKARKINGKAGTIESFIKSIEC